MSDFVNAFANTSLGQSFLNSLKNSEREHEQKMKDWKESLIELGCVALHSENGWINRVEKSIYNNSDWTVWGELKSGALVAIGCYQKYRIVKLTKFKRWQLQTHPLANDGRWFYV